MSNLHEVSPIKFGTDGWRAIIGDQFTFANVRNIALGIGYWIQESHPSDRPVLIGYDTRFLSPEFAEVLATTFVNMGIPVLMSSDFLPTPTLAWSVSRHGAAAGVMVTASHNPAIYNGIKVRLSSGAAAQVSDTDSILNFYNASLAQGLDKQLVNTGNEELLSKVDFVEEYLNHIEAQVDIDLIRTAGLRVLVDSMHGAASRLLSAVVNGGKTVVIDQRADVNPSFPDMRAPEPIAANLAKTIEMITGSSGHEFDCGFAFDGDGDRMGLIDERGDFVSALDTFSLLVHSSLEVRSEVGPVVRSLTMSKLVDKIARSCGQKVHETQVGFKHLAPVMAEEDAVLAGEESGGTAFRGHVCERDGLLSALRVLELIAIKNKGPRTLLDGLMVEHGQHRYKRIDFPFDTKAHTDLYHHLINAVPKTLAGRRVVDTDQMDGFRYHLEDGWWVSVRESGTEPLVRVYAEMETDSEVDFAIAEVARLLGLDQ